METIRTGCGGTLPPWQHGVFLCNETEERSMKIDKDFIRMIQRSAMTIYENAEKMAGNYSTQTGLDIGIRIRFGEPIEITVDQTLFPE